MQKSYFNQFVFFILASLCGGGGRGAVSFHIIFAARTNNSIMTKGPQSVETFPEEKTKKNKMGIVFVGVKF